MTEVVPDPARQRSFDEVYADEYPKLARLAFLLLGRTGEAEEVVQEAFIAVYERWFIVENPAAFVRTTTLNRCRDLGRRRGRHLRLVRRAVPRPADTGTPEYLVDALQQLDVTPRELVVLRYYLQLSVPEIAALVDQPEGTVKSRLHRALRQLQATLT